MAPDVAVLPRYLGQHGTDYHEEVCAVPERMFAAVSRLRAEKFKGHIGPRDTVLEYGAGLGYNLAALSCAQRYAYDVGPHLKERFLRLGIPFVTETKCFTDGAFDAVICHHVLEHAPDPWAVLRELRRLVRPGGTLILNVPYERERSYGRYDPSDKHGHLYSWNPQSFGALLSSAGWLLQSLNTPLFGYDRFAAVMADRCGGSERFYRALRRLLLVLRPRYEIAAILRKPA